MHSSTDGPLGCFHVLAICIALLWTWICRYLFQYLGYRPRSRNARSVGSSISNLRETAILFSIAAPPFFHKGSSFCPFPPTLVIFCFLASHPYRCEIFHCCLTCISLTITKVKSLHVPVVPLYIFVGKIYIFCPFLIRVLFFYYWVVCIPYVLTPFEIYGLQFSPIPWVAFLFWLFLLLKRNFFIWYGPTCLFLLLWPVLLVSLTRNHCQITHLFLPKSWRLRS